MDIPGVPTTVARANVVDFVVGIGFDHGQVRAVTICPQAVFVEVYALDDQGARFSVDGNAATHSVCIPIEG